MRVSERNGELVIAGVLCFIGILWIVLAGAMPYGEFSVPGPGFLPALLGALMCGVSLALGIRLFWSKPGRPIHIGHPRIWITIAALILLAVIFEPLGFFLTITLFVALILKLLSPMKWVACSLWAACGALVAYLFFDLLLGIQLPRIPWL